MATLVKIVKKCAMRAAVVTEHVLTIAPSLTLVLTSAACATQIGKGTPSAVNARTRVLGTVFTVPIAHHALIHATPLTAMAGAGTGCTAMALASAI